MATVYKAYDAGLDRFVALKVLPSQLLDEPEFRARFAQEAQIVARLEHPNIIPVFAFGVDREIPWMSMKLIETGSLAQRLKERRAERTWLVDVLQGVAAALDHAHSKGVVHRDVKPQNILIGSEGRPYLADFGIARMLEGTPRMTAAGAVMGTPEYMSPEQASGKPAGHEADLYALGIVAYEALFGVVPFQADTPAAVLLKHLNAPLPVPQPGECSEQVLQALLRALAKEPADRWKTAAAFVAALRAGISERPRTTMSGETETNTQALPPTGSSRKTGRRILLGLASAVVLGVALLAIKSGRQAVLLAPAPKPSGTIQDLRGSLRKSAALSAGRFSGHPISISPKKPMDVRDFLQLMADISGLPILGDPGVGGTASVNFVETPWDQVFQTVLDSVGLAPVLYDSHSVDPDAFVRIRSLSVLQSKFREIEARPMALCELADFSATSHLPPMLPQLKELMGREDRTLALCAALAAAEAGCATRPAIAPDEPISLIKKLITTGRVSQRTAAIDQIGHLFAGRLGPQRQCDSYWDVAKNASGIPMRKRIVSLLTSFEAAESAPTLRTASKAARSAIDTPAPAPRHSSAKEMVSSGYPVDSSAYYGLGPGRPDPPTKLWYGAGPVATACSARR